MASILDHPTIALAIAALAIFSLCVLLILQKQARARDQKSLSQHLNAARDSNRELEQRLSPLFDREKEIEKLNDHINQLNSNIDTLKGQYSSKKVIFDGLMRELAIFDERLAFSELGMYEPHFDFSDSEQFKSEIDRVRSEQKRFISEKKAVVSTTKWTVDGSVAKGQTMMNRNVRLTLRAFNGECDAAIANARWNNVNAIEKRIVNSRNTVNKLNESNAVYISEDYIQSKLKELYLTHEYREKLKFERDERAEQTRAAREEQRLLRDMERAEEEEERYRRLLAKAKSEAAAAAGQQLAVFDEQIRTLEKDLAEAHAKVERAQAMAERTRSGYVYIISNIGSFGEDIIKIGLTRRLDPVDGVVELGDASVPFSFDTHAIIYSDDAPNLERALHTQFAAARINTQNLRKEFFRANIDDVETAVKQLAPTAPFFRDIEAQEYRETLAKRNATLLVDANRLDQFPAAL